MWGVYNFTDSLPFDFFGGVRFSRLLDQAWQGGINGLTIQISV
jgi:hypothetical protein